MLDFKQDEENVNVRRWIDEYVAVLEYEIERVSIQEEREDFQDGGASGSENDRDCS